jgi:hypothetical protein
MKKFLVFFLILLILPSIFAVELNAKEQYAQGETVIATVSGNFISSLTKENILFYKEHTRIPMEYDIKGANGEYYIYALLAGKSAGNYSISIENAQYKKADEVISDKIVKNFSITDKIADFSVSPGFVFNEGAFSLKIENLQDNKINVNIKANLNDSKERAIYIYPDLSSEVSVSLVSGEDKQINFQSNTGIATLKTIRLQTNNTFYEVPVYLSASEGNSESTFSLEPSKFTYSLPTNSQVKKTVYIYNTGSNEMKNISISLSDSLKAVANVSVSKIEKLSAGANTQFELIFYSKAEAESEGELKARTGDTIAYSSISLKFISDYVVPENQSGQSSTKACAELEGVICNKEGYKCSKELIEAEDGFCCKGNCNAISAGSSGKIIAIIIGVVLVGGIVWFYFKKYKKAKKPVDLLAISKVKEV